MGSSEERLFSSEALAFLRDLKENNDREWFQPRKEQFETLLRQPAMAVVARLNEVLGRTAPDYCTDPARSLYRIYRDTRFSPDKTPYKTHIAANLWHRRLGKDGGAGLYFHVSPDEFLIAAGLYHCPAPMLLAERNHIATEHAALTKVLRRKSTRELFGELQGDRLTRPPKGFPAEHPAIEYLKHKDLLLERTLPGEVATQPGSMEMLTKHMLALVPFLDFLNEPFLRAKPQRDPLTMGV